MEAGHLRENPQTPQQQETPQAITQGLQKADGPSFSGKQSSHQTQRNNKLTSSGFKQQPICTPLAPTRNKNHLQNSLLRRTQFWVLKTFSKPASLKRASLVALPVAISHKVSLKPKLCASATLIQKTSKNEPKHGPKNGTARRSHFWDRMHSLVKEQKKSTFTVPFLGPSGGTKNETAKSQNPQQRPTLATNKKITTRFTQAISIL